MFYFFSQVEEHENMHGQELTHYSRRQLLVEACEGKEMVYVGNNSEKIVRTHLFYDRQHKFVYCGIEKIGTTFWKRVIKVRLRDYDIS